MVGAVAPVASDGRVQVTDTFADVGAGPARARRRHEGDPGRQRVGHATRRRVGRTGVRDHERVADARRPPSPSPDRSSTIDRSADAVTSWSTRRGVVRGVGVGRGRRHRRALVSVAACAGAVTTTVIVGAVAPVASAGRVQVTDTLPTFVHVQPGAGRGHEGDTRPAACPPPTRSPRRTDRRWPPRASSVTEPAAVTVAGPVLTIDRSADAVTVVVTDEVLFAGIGSAVGDDTVAVFVSDAALGRSRHHDRDRRRRRPRRQRRPGAGHRHVARRWCTPSPVPVADTNVTPAGSVSVTDRFAASDGPAFATTSE